MNQADIFLPFVGMLLLTLVVWVYMFARRIPFMASAGLLSRRYLTPEELTRLSPPAVASPADNFRNLFELPVIFYAVVLYLFGSGQVDALYVDAAWVFLVFRVLHSLVHCSFNHMALRFYLYLVSSLALWFMVVRIALRLAHW